jgi:hypothetical protein
MIDRDQSAEQDPDDGRYRPDTVRIWKGVLLVGRAQHMHPRYDFHRTVILGNSGAGKSWLAERLSHHLAFPPIDLDEIYWEPGGYKTASDRSPCETKNTMLPMNNNSPTHDAT